MDGLQTALTSSLKTQVWRGKLAPGPDIYHNGATDGGTMRRLRLGLRAPVDENPHGEVH